jgi:hypothetical protein
LLWWDITIRLLSDSRCGWGDWCAQPGFPMCRHDVFDDASVNSWATRVCPRVSIGANLSQTLLDLNELLSEVEVR